MQFCEALKRSFCAEMIPVNSTALGIFAYIPPAETYPLGGQAADGDFAGLGFANGRTIRFGSTFFTTTFLGVALVATFFLTELFALGLAVALAIGLAVTFADDFTIGLVEALEVAVAA